MKSNKLLMLVGLIAAIGAAPANASVSATATFSDFSVTLFDLNPTDGVTPTITWNSSYSNYATYTNAYTYDKNGYGANGYSYHYGQLDAANSSTATLSHASATASAGASSVAGTPSGSVSASGSAFATQTSGGTSFNATAYDPYSSYVTFTLSANTVAVFSAKATTQATTSVGYDSLNKTSESANASASLSVSGTNGVNGSQNASDSLYANASYSYIYQQNPQTGKWEYVYSPQSVLNSGKLSGSFVNSSSGNKTGSLFMGVSVNGYTNIAAVPEPESYAMFLAGLGLVGAVVRRRRSAR
jgi:hypothetical protein